MLSAFSSEKMVSSETGEKYAQIDFVLHSSTVFWSAEMV